MELTDQTALVTGGTAGIGLACARLMAREGASVVITGRDEQPSTRLWCLCAGLAATNPRPAAAALTPRRATL